ncbi:MAG: mandelate racemase/muconate lactonizing enzyme family protein [Thermogutta sp.]
MLICDVEFQLIKVFPTRSGVPDRLVLVRIQTDEGVDGWGEVQLPWRLGELLQRRDMILPLIAGKNVLDISELSQMEQLPRRLRAALEMACWDAAGKILKQPMCRFFGGTYRTRVPTASFVFDTDNPELLEEARRWLDNGIAYWILGTSGNVEADVKALERIRERFGAGVQIQFDARNRFRLGDAVRLCTALQALGVEMIIDVLAAGHGEEYHQLRREVDCPLAIRVGPGMEALWAAVRAQRVHHLVLDVTEGGGISAARDAIAVARAAGLSISLSVGRSLGLAVAALLHLGAAMAGLTSAHEILCEETLQLAMRSGLKRKDCLWEVPDAPGLGIELNRDMLEGDSWSNDLSDVPM